MTSELALWEIVEVEHLKRFFRHFRVDCVFDVGASRGQYKSLLRDHVGFTGHIISFEPIPQAFAEIRSRVNLDAKWYVKQVALDRFSGEAQFNIMQNDKFSSLKSPSTVEFDRLSQANQVREVIRVQTSTLAKEIEIFSAELGFSSPFLKMDTQGNDVAVVEGAGTDILRFVGLQSELSVKKLYNGTNYYHETISYYQAKGFALCAIFDNTAGHFPDLVEIDCLMYRR